MSDHTPLPPAVNDLQEQERIAHSYLAWRILYGKWRGDLENRVREKKGDEIADAWGEVDISRNPFKSIWESIAVLYSRPPIVGHDEEEAEQIIRDALNSAGLWQMMSSAQRDTLALRELFIRIDVASDGQLQFRKVFPHCVVARAAQDKPDVPVRIEEQRFRCNPITNEYQWTYDILDISDPKNPLYMVMDSKQEEDLTELYLGENQSGENYPYRRSDGTPILPYVLYHAAKTGYLFDERANSELIEATLQIGVQYTLFNHAVLNASNPQRIISGAEFPKEELLGSSLMPINSVKGDHANILLIEPADGNNQVQFHQFAPGADIDKLISSIMEYERGILSTVGLNAADLLRASGDPRSGFAMLVTRESQREAQKRFEPQFSQGDLELIAKSAIILNRFFNSDLPEDGYRIRYQAIPQSAAESKAVREEVLELMAAGLMDRVTAYQRLNEGVSRKDAEEAIIRIDREKLSIGGTEWKR